MTRILFILLLISSSSYSQDTLVVEDGSIWFSKSSCSVDFRCYDNVDDIVSGHCSDSITITSIELIENVFEKAPNIYTECRAQRLADYLKGRHRIEVDTVIATPIRMTREEMKTAIQEQNFRTVIIIFEEMEITK